jgi:hypothetical protein
MGNKYGTLYFPSELLEENMHFFKEIWGKIGKNEINKKDVKGELK